MTRTHEKVRCSPEGKVDADVVEAVEDAVRHTEAALKVLGGRWKITIVFLLFSQPVLRFSQLERAIVGISQKMLVQQLRELEHDGVVQRTVHPEVPPKVEYALTDVGRAVCPALDALIRWSKLREKENS